MSQHLSSKSKLVDAPLRIESVIEAPMELPFHHTSAAGVRSVCQPEAGLIQEKGLSSEPNSTNQLPNLKKHRVKAARPSLNQNPLRLTGSHAHYETYLKRGFLLAPLPLPLPSEGPQLKSKRNASKGLHDSKGPRQSLPLIPQRGQQIKAVACIASSIENYRMASRNE